MANSGTLVVRLLADDKGLQKGLDGAGKQVEKTGDRFAKAGKKMTLFASVPIAAAMTGAAMAASNLEQSVGAVESIFGSAKGPVEEFGETAADAAGLSKREVNEMAAVLGASLQGLGFEVDESATKVVELQKRGADMAATFGGTTKEALDAIASLMRGERDPIEKYGVSIKQVDINARVLAMGLDTSTTAAKKKSEAIAGLDLLMAQTAKTEGQFARESDSAAGSMQRAKAEFENATAELGTHLLPIVAKVAGGVADVASAFGDLPDPVQKGILAMAGIVAVTGPILTVVGNLGKLKGAVEAIKWANVAVAATGPLAALTLATAGATAGFIMLNKVADAFGKADAELDESIAGTVNHLALLGTGVQESSESLKDNAVAAFIAGAAQRGFSSDLEEVSEAGQVVTDQVERAVPVLKALASETGVTSERIAQLATEMGINLADASDEQRQKLAAAVSEIGRAVTPTERLEDAQETLGNEFATAAEEVDGFKDALDAALGVHLSAEEATIRVREAIGDLRTEYVEGAKDGETLQGFQDRLTLSTIGLTKKVQDEVDALVESGAVAADAASQKEALRSRLLHLADTLGGPMADELREHVERLDDIPDTAVTDVEADTGPAREALAALEGDAAAQGAAAGGAYGDGITSGIEAKRDAATEAARELGRQVTAALSNLWGISSPSRVAARLGAYYTEGLVEGIESGQGDLDNAASTVADVLDRAAARAVEVTREESKAILDAHANIVQSQERLNEARKDGQAPAEELRRLELEIALAQEEYNRVTAESIDVTGGLAEAHDRLAKAVDSSLGALSAATGRRGARRSVEDAEQDIIDLKRRAAGLPVLIRKAEDEFEQATDPRAKADAGRKVRALRAEQMEMGATLAEAHDRLIDAQVRLVQAEENAQQAAQRRSTTENLDDDPFRVRATEAGLSPEAIERLLAEMSLPRFHGGGTFSAPPGMGEGLAMLRNGERVLTPDAPVMGGIDQKMMRRALDENNELLRELIDAVKSGRSPQFLAGV